MEIDKINPDSTRYIDWFCDYLLPNKPCIFTSNITKQWRSREEWRKSDDSPNFDFLIDRFGAAEVPVVDVGQSSGYDSQTQSSMKLRDYISNHMNDQSFLYLKDWHFVKLYPNYRAYKVPVYFENDWMNEYWDMKNDPVEIDYRFVYMGGENTWTPFHADVFRSFSWSANVCGKKRWSLTKPGHEEKIERYWRKLNCNSNENTKLNDIRNIFENYSNEEKNMNVIDIVQEPGEIIFVPSYWHHQVHNLDQVISINHNWCNGANIRLVWNYLRMRLEAVKKELADIESTLDCESWAEKCQQVLKCDAGLDYNEFLSIGNLIVENRFQSLKKLQYKNDRRIIESLFHCDICGNHLEACDQTPYCLQWLKSRIGPLCTCIAWWLPRCQFCCAFFDIFDVRTALFCMLRVFASEDPSDLDSVLVPVAGIFHLMAFQSQVESWFRNEW